MPFENFLPLLDDGIKPVVDGIKEYPIWFGDVIVMAVALGNVKKVKHMTL